MRQFGLRVALTILAAFFVSSAAFAGSVHGTVINRTTGKRTPDVPLTFLSPTQGMRDLGSAKSDAQGQFTASNDAIGTVPVLIRATYHDVSFNTFAPPGRPEVEVEIFDISKDLKTISIASHIVIFQPQGDKLIGAEEYEIQNPSQPPVAYFRTEGNFDFAIPENAIIGQVTTTSQMGMSVNQASIEKGKGRFAIAFAFRPGQSNVRLSYELPYPNNSASIKLPAVYGGAKLLIVAPPGVTIAGDGLNPAGQEQGMMVYTHEPLAAKASLLVQLSGVGTPQAADAGGTQGQQGGQEGNSRAESENIQAVPGRLDDLKWPLMIGLAALFALGAIILSRKQVVVAAGPAAELEDAPVAPRKASAKAAKVAPATAASANSVAEVNASVSASLDSLKDAIFRLELRKQAGTISEEEYARERAAVEKRLRDLVRG